MTVPLKVACGETWPAVAGCTAWGALSSHGCRLDPGHEGIHRCLCGRRKPEEYITKSGKVLTDTDIQALADEAEQGYDISQLASRE